MKIAVQGTFIDTESIYSIGEIYKEYDSYCFDINYYNSNACKTVRINLISVEKQMELSEFYNQLRISCKYPKEGRVYDDEDKEKIDELNEKIYSTNQERLEKMRLDIVKIWAENQLTIPKFEVENY